MYVQCFNCKKPMTYFPAAISRKTGKPYKAFYSCPICKKTIGEELANKQSGKEIDVNEIFEPTPKETGDLIVIDLLKEIKAIVEGIEKAVGSK